MNETLCRPFCTEYAWAFDLLIDRPVEKECGVIAAWLVGRQILPGAAVLDAGCVRDRVFDAVLEAGEAESGVSIHLVDREYDTGSIVRQCRVPVFRDDSVDDLEARVRAREKEFVVETLAVIAIGDSRLGAAAG